MKRFISFALVVTVLSLAALADAKNSATLNLMEKTKIGTAELMPGECSLSWTGKEGVVQVTISQGNVNVTAPARIIEARNSQVAILTNHEENSTAVLTGVQLKKLTLEFVNE